MISWVRYHPTKLPITSTLSLAILADISLVTPALAVVNIDYVTVGNAGNAADTGIITKIFFNNRSFLLSKDCTVK